MSTITTISERKLKNIRKKKLELLISWLGVCIIRLFFIGASFYYFFKMGFVPYSGEFALIIIIALMLCLLPMKEWIIAVRC